MEEQFSEWLESKERSGKMMDKPALGKPREALTMLRKMAIVRLKANGYSLRTAGQIFPEKKRFVESLQDQLDHGLARSGEGAESSSQQPQDY